MHFGWFAIICYDQCNAVQSGRLTHIAFSLWSFTSFARDTDVQKISSNIWFIYRWENSFTTAILILVALCILLVCIYLTRERIMLSPHNIFF